MKTKINKIKTVLKQQIRINTLELELKYKDEAIKELKELKLTEMLEYKEKYENEKRKLKEARKVNRNLRAKIKEIQK